MNILPGRLEKGIKTPLKDYILKRKYVFHHLQKCGGSSLKKSLEEYFILKKDYSYNNEPRIELSRLKPFEMLTGHFEMEETRLLARYPEVLDRNVFLFTMIREPMELKISLYYYWKARGWLNNEQPLRDFLNERPNYLSFLLGCNSVNYEKVLLSYSFIGLMDKYEMSMKLLSGKIGRKLRSGWKENISARDDQYSKIVSDKGYHGEFRDENLLDYKIYDHVIDSNPGFRT